MEVIQYFQRLLLLVVVAVVLIWGRQLVMVKVVGLEVVALVILMVEQETRQAQLRRKEAAVAMEAYPVKLVAVAVELVLLEVLAEIQVAATVVMEPLLQ
jgi:hypothetical protein